MYDFEQMDKRLIIFGTIFGFANKLQSVLDCQMPDVTSRQWFIMLMLEMFEKPPTLNELARQCDSSHQNTKQLCIKLEQKGFIRIEKDEKDGRAMRIIRTVKCDEWAEKTHKISQEFIDELFFDLTEDEIRFMCSAQLKLYAKLKEMDSSTDYPVKMDLDSHIISERKDNNE